MNATAAVASSMPTSDALQAGFLRLLPRIELHARIYFRHLGCAQEQEERVAEAVALAWRWYGELVRRGKDVAQLASSLASYAARCAGAGRRLCGQERANDVLSRRAQRRHGFGVERLPDFSTLGGNRYEEALHDNTQTPVVDQVCFRCDFPAWLRRWTDRDRRVIDELMAGERTRDVARRQGLTPGRISQLRREYHEDWTRFQGEAVAVEAPTGGVA